MMKILNYQTIALNALYTFMQKLSLNFGNELCKG
jgi:hypothetical protein